MTNAIEDRADGWQRDYSKAQATIRFLRAQIVLEQQSIKLLHSIILVREQRIAKLERRIARLEAQHD